MIEHLTETGPNAGRTFCGAKKNPDLQYSHLPYSTKGLGLAKWLDSHVKCEACKKIALSDDSEE